MEKEIISKKINVVTERNLIFVWNPHFKKYLWDCSSYAAGLIGNEALSKIQTILKKLNK